MKAKMDFYMVKNEEGVPNRTNWAVRIYGDLGDSEGAVRKSFENMSEALLNCMEGLEKAGFDHDKAKSDYPCIEADDI